MKKNQLNRLEFWKNWPVWFWFYKPETKKKKPNQTQTEKNQAKPSQNRAKQKKPSKTEKTEPNRFEPIFVVKKQNWNQSVWTGFVSVRFWFFFLNQFGYFFFIKTEPKMITPRFYG